MSTPFDWFLGDPGRDVGQRDAVEADRAASVLAQPLEERALRVRGLVLAADQRDALAMSRPSSSMAATANGSSSPLRTPAEPT